MIKVGLEEVWGGCGSFEGFLIWVGSGLGRFSGEGIFELSFKGE